MESCCREMSNKRAYSIEKNAETLWHIINFQVLRQLELLPRKGSYLKLIYVRSCFHLI